MEERFSCLALYSAKVQYTRLSSQKEEQVLLLREDEKKSLPLAI
jgi:hypothetical protein